MVLGILAGRSAIWIAIAILALGLAIMASGLRPDLRRDLRRDDNAGGRTGAPRAQPRLTRNPAPPTLAGLGGRVEQVLRQAEEAAQARRDDAEQEAAAMLAAARAEAERIVEAARTGAAGLTSTGDGTQAGSVG